MTSTKFDILCKKFNEMHGALAGDHYRPTGPSILSIESHFEVRLPSAFYEFCERCPGYNSAFCWINGDLKNPCHIIRVNSVKRNTKRRKHQDKWRKAFSDDILAIEYGHDLAYVGYSIGNLKVGDTSLYLDELNCDPKRIYSDFEALLAEHVGTI